MKENNYIAVPARKSPSRPGGRPANGAARSKIAADHKSTIDFLGLTKSILTDKFACIIEGLAQKSSEGSLPHTKYLFDIGGLREELMRQIQNNGEPSVAELLMAEVKRHRDLEAAAIEKAKSLGDSANELCDTANNCGARE